MEMEHKHTIEQYKEKGVSVEEVARHIAEDHLKENPNYYKILRKLKLAKGGVIVCRRCSNDWESNEKNKFRFVCKKCGTNNKKYYTSSTEKKKFEDGGSIMTRDIKIVKKELESAKEEKAELSKQYHKFRHELLQQTLS